MSREGSPWKVRSGDLTGTGAPETGSKSREGLGRRNRNLCIFQLLASGLHDLCSGKFALFWNMVWSVLTYVCGHITTTTIKSQNASTTLQSSLVTLCTQPFPCCQPLVTIDLLSIPTVGLFYIIIMESHSIWPFWLVSCTQHNALEIHPWSCMYQ